MENIIIIAIVLIAVVAAVIRSRKHFKGGCCGGSTVVHSEKKLTEPKIGEKLLTIEGMHCENCAVRVENALNRLDGVACRVKLRKKTAVVSYSREVPDALLRGTIAKAGYQVTEIR
ncbi:MAG: heavy-metal-associated domain-containing protein [Oscillospiraceae bacterium]|nr:heavy-metal-associated domain-containing protein [Oscillospiraceae bacterium]